AGTQQTQMALLADDLAPFDRRSLILAGDFNSTPWSAALRRLDRALGLERRTRAMFTFPVQPYSRYALWSPLPFLPLDHVFAGEDWKTVRVTVGRNVGSDHLPVVAVLTR
ncbi:MAG: endonuclease/exonuclease/phosphatase family protein, partial [Caulobacteraceae bacterium]|nr:endonuclease/exonuclease/phosphatase family protein [Caulobacteraceae bacterium]